MPKDKLRFALADSGMGGGMTAAFLRGEVRQLGSYFCLPIGTKPEHTATAYTAAMALWPLVAPLAGKDGKADGHIAESVIIACNSASVRREGALELMKNFCTEVAADSANKMGIEPQIRSNILALHDQIEKDPDYLSHRVREIVTETARVGVEAVRERLRNHDDAFVRIDSTNGTAQSGAYPARFEEELKHVVDGGSLERKTFSNTVKGEKSQADYVVNHDVFRFRMNGQQKVLVLESRGNPPWVPAIEGNEPHEKRAELVGESTQVTQLAIDRILANPQFKAFEATAKDAGLELERCFEDGRAVPNVSMLCCTHYPAMREALQEQYGSQPSAVFIDQAVVVETIGKELDPSSTDPDSGDLHLVLTVGSQNYGGTSRTLKTSVPQPEATATTLFKVLQTTLEQRPANEARRIGSVTVVAEGPEGPEGPAPAISGQLRTGTWQSQFELVHRFIGMPLKVKILAEQGLEEVPNAGLRQPKLRLKSESEQLRIHPKATGAMQKIMSAFSPGLRERLGRLGELMTLGEARGIDKLAPYNAQGEQLAASVARIREVQAQNANNPNDPPHRVGILTGFSVVDNQTRGRLGGENDGPPGAVLMARSMVARGIPVTMVTDRSAEPSLVAALVGSGLARLTTAGEQQIHSAGGDSLTLEHIELQSPATKDLLKFEVPAYDNRTGTSDPQAAAAAVRASARKLREQHVATMISIERPSPTVGGGNLRSMVGIDIGAYNLDASPLLRNDTIGHHPVTIGMGDGGNELGTGGIATIAQTGRDERLEPFVKNGDVIAADPRYQTDMMVLGTVSNHCGMALAMALDASYEDEPDTAVKLHQTVEVYNGTIKTMFDMGMSLDGVNKQNLVTVDGRALGTVEEARKKSEALQGEVPLGTPETTHNDTFLLFEQALSPPLPEGD